MKISKKKLTSADIEKKLLKFSGWTVNTKKTELSKTFDSHSFVDSLAFVARIAVHAEILAHHPEVELTDTRVKVTLTSHEEKGLTGLDFELAKRIENL